MFVITRQRKVYIISGLSLFAAICSFYFVHKYHTASRHAALPVLPQARLASQNSQRTTSESRVAISDTPLTTTTSSLAIVRDKLRNIRDHYNGQERTDLLLGVATQAMLDISLEDGLTLLQELPTGAVYDAASAALGKRFAELDPARGIGWLKSLPETKEGTYATMAFYNKLALVDPALSLQSLKELNPVRQGEAMRSVLNELGNQNAEQLIVALQDPDFRALCAQHALRPQNYILNGILNANEFEKAATLANQPDYSTKDMSNVIGRWARADPNSVASWLEGNVGSLQEDRLAASEKLTALWATMDAIEASAWLQKLPPGSLRDYGIKGLVEAIAPKDGRSAAEWVESIQDPAFRAVTAESVVARWATYDKEAALTWLSKLKSEGGAPPQPESPN
jgi:hypothetical protein